MPTIAALMAAVVGVFAAGLLVPSGVALAEGDWRALEALLLFAAAYSFFATVIIMAVMPRVRRLSRSGVFLGAVGMWLALAFAATLPFIVVERLSFFDALFEAVSAVITLGVSLKPSAQISETMGIYRVVSAWLGGLLTLLLAVYVIGRFRVGGTPDRHLRLILHGTESGDPKLVRTFLDVFVPYLAMTLVCMAALVLARVSLAKAFPLSLSLLATNGFVPGQTGATLLNNTGAELIVMIFMVVGATGIIWQRAVLGRRWQMAMDQGESLAFALFVLVLASLVAFSAFAFPGENFTPVTGALNRAFDLISIMTTTGITHDLRYGVGLPFELVLGLAFVGGCAYSTAGGLKLFRLMAMLHHSINEVRRLVYPHGVLIDSVESDQQSRNRAEAVWGAFYLAIMAIVLGAIYFAAFGTEMVPAIGLAIGSMASVGNLVADSLGPEPQLGTLLGITVLGLAARIELLILLAALSQRRW